MNLTRREMIKMSAAAFAAGALNIPFTKSADAGDETIVVDKWIKGACRFCGTGCGVLVGVSDGKAIAVKGDPACSVNKGLCCMKGYHSVQALYGRDRLTKAMVRRNGR